MNKMMIAVMLPTLAVSTTASALVMDVNPQMPDRSMMVCTTEYMPVCGIDPVTGEQKEYSNKCVRNAYGARACDISDMLPGGGLIQDGGIVGDDANAKKCLQSTGYSYDATLGKCIRIFEPQDLYAWAAKVGLTTTKDVTAFNADALITRDEAAAIISRAIEAEFVHLRAPQTLRRLEFTDMNMISPEFRNAVQYVHNAMIMRGNEEGAFVPKAPLTTYEALVILSRMLSQPEVTNSAEALAFAQKLGLTIDAHQIGAPVTRKNFFTFFYAAADKNATPGFMRDENDTATTAVTELEGKWYVRSFQKSGEKVITPDVITSWVEFTGDKIFAKFCNAMNGTFSLRGDIISLGDGIASTKMLCQGLVMDIEQAFSFDTAKYVLSADKKMLTLTTQGGDVFILTR